MSQNIKVGMLNF